MLTAFILQQKDRAHKQRGHEAIGRRGESPLPVFENWKKEKSALILGKNAFIANVSGFNFSLKMQFLIVFRGRKQIFFPAEPFFLVL